MGSDKYYHDESPVRREICEDFWIDQNLVTNADFKRFVDDTGYVTLVERPPDPQNYPGIAPDLMHAGSIVFTPPDHPVDLAAGPSWWSYAAGADWRHPLGSASGLAGKDDHPVVHVAYEDAAAYACWAGKSLPTEIEWEYAARGGLDAADYAWGNDFQPQGRPMAKTWQGIFPWRNLADSDQKYTSPVRSYPANGYGLYDMIGNVWEWTQTRYDHAPRGHGQPPGCCESSGKRASQQADAHEPAEAEARFPLMVVKGGSHLCSPDYCRRYRPAARWPQAIDSATSHIGFRCVVRPND